MYPDRDTIQQLLSAPDVLLGLLQEKSKYRYITKHLMSGPSGNQLVFCFPRRNIRTLGKAKLNVSLRVHTLSNNIPFHLMLERQYRVPQKPLDKLTVFYGNKYLIKRSSDPNTPLKYTDMRKSRIVPGPGLLEPWLALTIVKAPANQETMFRKRMFRHLRPQKHVARREMFWETMFSRLRVPLNTAKTSWF